MIKIATPECVFLPVYDTPATLSFVQRAELMEKDRGMYE